MRADDIRRFRNESPDFERTEELKAKFQRLKDERKPFFLTAIELNEIFHWKLDRQYGRAGWRLSTNPDKVYETVTEAAFKVSVPRDLDYEIEVRLAILTALRGVGVGVASAILALVKPDAYCVIDFRGWRALFGEMREDFSVANYKHYRAEVERLARELSWSVQEVDLALWAYDKQQQQGE